MLLGMRNTISQNSNLSLIVELNPRALRLNDSSPEALVKLINSLGFIPLEIHANNALLPPNVNEKEKTRNLLCLRPERLHSIIAEYKNSLI